MRRHLLTLALTAGLVVTGLAPAAAQPARDVEPGAIIYSRWPHVGIQDRSAPDQYRLEAVTPDTRVFTRLMTGNFHGARLSPNGRWVAFSIYDGSVERANSIEVRRTDGSGGRRVAFDRLEAVWSNLAWSPDGRKVAFGFGDGPATSPWTHEIRILDVERGTFDSVPLPEEVANVGSLNWSVDGEWFVFDDWDYTGDFHTPERIWRMRSDGSMARSLTGERDRQRSYQDPVLSHDGTRIAYHVFGEGEVLGDLWMMNADGTDPRPVIPARERDFGGVAWSPHDDELALSIAPAPEDPDRAVSIWRVGLDGEGLTQVTSPPGRVVHAVQDWRILSTSTASACPPGEVPHAGFDDVAGAHAGAVDCAVWHGLASGRSAGTYAPAMPVRRDQIATFLARLLERAGVDLPEPTDQGFDDIDGNTHADAINQLADLGIITGTTATTYRPAAPMTRAQMAALLVRTYEHATGTTLPRALDEFDDDNGTTHETAIDKTANAGFATGTTISRYQPGGNVRRDQMATFLTRITNRLVRDGHTSLPQ